MAIEISPARRAACFVTDIAKRIAGLPTRDDCNRAERIARQGIITDRDRQEHISTSLYWIRSDYGGSNLFSLFPNGNGNGGVTRMIAEEDEVIFTDPRDIDRELVRRAVNLLKSGRCGVR
ncbi:MAG: hypothetical protein HY428_01590 [Candidatus Levybacteria bacterium]|nr:hypothetical protein [Candidatus Levybacteria bacterium]